MRLPARNDINARWSPTSYSNPSPMVVEVDIYRHTCDRSVDVFQQLGFSYLPTLRFLIMEILERQRLPGTFDKSVWFEEQYSPSYSRHPYWLSLFSDRKWNFQNGVRCRIRWFSHWIYFKALICMLNIIIYRGIFSQ